MNTAQTLESSLDAPCCLPSEQPAISLEDAQQRAAMFKALADPNRLRLLSIVKAGESGEACVCDLTEPLDLGQPTVSHHLKILVEAGLLHREKRGTWAYYSLVPGALDRVSRLLTSL
ncbi:ArsR/SmtB family transcription factor [Arthrobacter tumbae]|uniref:ArsR/SmtB family transcription factor n=1 Tax=Arthrobacter tumbae TaxID=163874 RepID=UPI0019598D7D|nr:metalloregulator ArsR/SmtB family transcription factor [Arthrobacter tumbae]MBM7780923.1 ArsR family transcriptional regulator [Arthrobacter tumbae]